MDWSRDGKQLLVHESISANQSHLWVVDVATGEKKQITPKSNDEVAYDRAAFSADGKGIYVTTDRDNEFARLAYFDLGSMQPQYLTSDIKWDVDDFDLSEDGKAIVLKVLNLGQYVHKITIKAAKGGRLQPRDAARPRRRGARRVRLRRRVAGRGHGDRRVRR